ncbi:MULTISPECIES: hypothetical protein [Trichocoleus]|uniref:Holin n=1 Tax=Trichocoleus desertorum GB2-A4 TaxID=2933944 RepID=A0ABV0JCW6_9CYAN|nr:hypothetical protein [Trichocoleus sp. FACHB-46]MBD1864275.1 hypothetical protein [Trichocoleus sp. FACHB-46]
MPPAKAKSIFQSRTFWGAMVALLPAIAIVAPPLGKAADEGRGLSGTEIANIVVGITGVLGGGTAIAGRVAAATPVYTPEWAPGPNASDFDEGEEEPKQTS